MVSGQTDVGHIGLPVGVSDSLRGFGRVRPVSGRENQNVRGRTRRGGEGKPGWLHEQRGFVLSK